MTGILGARTACALPAAKPSIRSSATSSAITHGVSQRRPPRQRLDPYLQGAGGEPQRSVFYQGAQWNPMDGSRQDGPGRVTMTCESGSVARCMRWGYRPWATATASAQSGLVSLVDHHQACIHMKRAAYCGDSRTQTMDGTSLYIQDQLAPAAYRSAGHRRSRVVAERGRLPQQPSPSRASLPRLRAALADPAPATSPATSS